MYMAYTTNPHLPRVRMNAVQLVRQGWSTHKVARHTGYNQSTIVRWVHRAPQDGRRNIPTQSSRPHFHPARLSQETVRAIIDYRIRHKRCAEVLHYLLIRDGYRVSLSSVKRTLRREGFVKKNPWKRYHQSPPRPKTEKPGDLIQIDTIHKMKNQTQLLYVYTLIDIESRWVHAMAADHISTWRSLHFVRLAQERFPVSFEMIQSDHGSEFSSWFTEHVQKQGTLHRHSRKRRPTDNGHVERFNRTLQEECLNRIPTTLKAYRKAIPSYLHFYNTERPHLSLNMKTPQEMMQSY